MKIDGVHTRSVWKNEDGSVGIIDQRLLPHELRRVSLADVDAAAEAISSMQTRGAPLIGAVAAYGLALALFEEPTEARLEEAYDKLLRTRPTAVNLKWALDRVKASLQGLCGEGWGRAAWAEADAIADEDAAACAAIGEAGLPLIRARFEAKGGEEPVQILTHCNAGWLATVDWGTALAPIYKAHDAGVAVHVWVDETRPRNQGAALTAWELSQHGVPHTVIPDNAGGHLMQHGMVDLCIVGTDRTTRRGDAANKIGTYLKALAAMDNGVPFYVALPKSTLDLSIEDGLKQIRIEQRLAREVTHIQGLAEDGSLQTVQLTPKGSPAANFGFDVTPARLITGFICEDGVKRPDALA